MFVTGQVADHVLSTMGLGASSSASSSGGAQLFNHPMGMASDGTRLAVADTRNNRVLIWNSPPSSGQPPDVVLGQASFDTHEGGRDLAHFNWPVGVAMDGRRLVVADTYNDRLLVWLTFPTTNGQPADFAIQGRVGRANIEWPWAVWTDGERLVATSTMGRQLLVWRTFPTHGMREPDIVVSDPAFGTPRSIGSDGRRLVVGDHNADGGAAGNLFWKAFPENDSDFHDFLMRTWPGAHDQNPAVFFGPTITRDGKLIVLSNAGMAIWHGFPSDADDAPDVTFEGQGFPLGASASGDGSGLAMAGGRLYASLYNGNKLVAFSKVPTSADEIPTVVLGAPDLATNTLATHFVITNPVPATNGRSLFVSSDFDRALHVWRDTPKGPVPDWSYSLPEAPWDNAISGGRLVLAGGSTIYVWDQLPLNGELPSRTFQGRIGNVDLRDVKGVALDGANLYVADRDANKVYVFDGIPANGTAPVATLEVDRPTRLSSDGTFLVVTATESNGSRVRLYRTGDIKAPPVAVAGAFNLPEGALAANGKLFVADTAFNRVHVWHDIVDASRGAPADVFLGARDDADRDPGIGQAELFWPAALAYDGKALWVGEFKFSGRLVRFS